MENFKLKESIGYAVSQGKPITAKVIASHLWKTSSESTQSVNMYNLITGRTNAIKPEWVVIICELTGVDANFLFNQKQNERKIS